MQFTEYCPECEKQNRFMGTKRLYQLFVGGLVTKSCPTPVTPWTVASQTHLSVGFPRQENEWVAISSSKGSSQPRDQTCLSLRLLHWQLDSLLSEPFCLVSDSKLFSKESWSSSFFFPSVSAKLTSLRRYLLSSQSLTGTISDWLHHVQGGHVEWITCLHCPWLVYLLRGG